MSSEERTVSSESAGSDATGNQPSSASSDKAGDQLSLTSSDGSGNQLSSPSSDGGGDQLATAGTDKAGDQGSGSSASGHPHDLDLLAKMEEANRQLQITPPAITDSSPPDSTGSCPTELDLLAKLEQANMLLEADKKSCKALTPTHSREGSTVGVTTGPSTAKGTGHSRKGSSTSQVSTASSNSQAAEEEAASPEKNIWEIWGKIVNDWASAKKKPAFIRQLVRKGIPHPFRGLAWQLLLDVNTSPMKDHYVEYLKQKSPSEKMIRRDIARTFPEHDFFKEKDGLGQESLFHVMKAYSLVDREVGYCQGSGFIVGLLLMQMPEEEAFAVLVKLMQDYRLRELFKPSMAELGLCMYKLECLIQELLPDLYTHFQTQSFHTSMYASSWFLTLFATNVPLSVACRIMDVFISEGMDVIFRMGIAILQSSQSDLLSMDMEAMLQFFQRDIGAKFERDEDTLFNMSYHVRISAKRFKRLEKEYTALKSKENEDQIELRRLRTENRLLRQRIDSLEKESASLADRLIQYQLTRAQEAEETYALKNELSMTKQKFSQTQKQLNEAQSMIGDIKERTDSIHSASSLDEGEAQVVVQGLQEELIYVRLREAENTAVVKTLKQKIQELEQFNTRLQEAPSNDVQCLQEELIAVKLREAEANLSLKEMRQTVAELEASWKRHISSDGEPLSPKGGKKELSRELKKAQEDLMSAKLKEASVLSALKDTKQKVMELETSNQICSNQIRRMDEENKKLKVQIDDDAKQEAELQRQIKSLLRKIDDIETKRREEGMMARIREAECDQTIGELKQKIAAIEIQNEEVLAADRLDSKGGNQELQNTIFDLQEEVLQLKMSASPKSPHTSTSSTSPSTTNKTEFEDDFDDDDDLEDPESLNRTLSEIIEGKRSSTSLIAYLNRENSDNDSVSGSSESSSSNRLGAKALLRELEWEKLKGEKSESVVRFEDIPLDKDSEQTSSDDKSNNSAIQNLDQSGTGNVTGSQVKNGSILVTQSSSGSDSQTEAENGALTANQTQTSTSTKADSGKRNQSLVNGDVSKDADYLMDSNDNISVGSAKHKTKPDISTA